MGKKTRQWKRRKDTKENHRSGKISFKNDSRVICPKTGRPKFRYPTLKKALLACEYWEKEKSEGQPSQRPYYCKRCCSYHTTSETKKEYHENLQEVITGRYDEGVQLSQYEELDNLEVQELLKNSL